MLSRGAMSLLAVALVCAGCSADESTPGVRSVCAEPSGPLGECAAMPLASADEACWRLVECGAIPVANPEDEPDCCFDWAECVEYIEELPDPQYELSLACIESASCEALRAGGSPDRTNDLPPCLEYSDR